MSVMTALNDLGFCFAHSYTQLPDYFYTRMRPVPVRSPEMVIVNKRLADELSLNLSEVSHDDLEKLFSGNVLPDGAEPIAQAYAGHQFGHFTMLGDGRAHLLGEYVTPKGKRVDVQLKGSGLTPYGRRGDGRAALGPMLREYIISEAMYALGIPTTRSLAVVTTGEPVYRETMLQGAILTRIASSHLRVGTFEYVAANNDKDGLKQLADYAINRHYPDLWDGEHPYLAFVKAVMERQISLIVHWLRVGFIHGVMNTDNMTISGETIDYGPCAFMDSYDPQTVFSSIDTQGRYAYANQPYIAQWNLARFAETLLPLLHDDIDQAANMAEKVIQSFSTLFQNAWLAMMRNKLGLWGEEKEDEVLIGDLLKCMQRQKIDFTNFFLNLISKSPPEGEAYRTEEFSKWWRRWQNRLQRNDKPLESSFSLMRASNPVIIPRNHKVEEALKAAEEHSDYSKLYSLLEVLAKPYISSPEYTYYQRPPEPGERVYQTFCGT